MISAVNSCNSVIQTKPIQFKGEQVLAEPVPDKEKANATKLMIGGTALAGVVALGIAGYKGKLGKTVQELSGGAEKTVQKTVEKEVPKPPKEVKVKPSKYKDFTGVVDTKNAKVTFENGRVVESELKDGTVKWYENGRLWRINNSEGKTIYSRVGCSSVGFMQERIRPEHPRYKSLRASEDSYETITVETYFDKDGKILKRRKYEGASPALRKIRERYQERLRNTQSNKQEG